ncbi:WXG100 family type VII secretion target [Nocardioides campestrisoli]|uniref:WXG100 family type VII secretion target n=1 Tax=Nocardioides campestrisoli TaxID=2736757 RepID=UPI00163DCC29|nr:WXG100 family type VII secretion target [Nocardioides campestrisoli]
MNRVSLTHAAFAKAKADVSSAADRLHHDRNSIDQRVTSFLGTGWTGSAADAFDHAWEDWRQAAGDVLSGLRAMRELLDAAHHDYTAADDASQQKLDQLSVRLIERLG